MIGTPVYDSDSRTVGSRTITFRTIETNHNNITIANIGTSNISNASGSPYGINGTFFYNGDPPPLAQAAGYVAYQNYRIVNNNGNTVRLWGNKNRLTDATDGDCGTLGFLDYSYMGKSYFCADITNLNAYDNYGIVWAVGGSNLYLDEAITETQFNNRVSGGQDTTYAAHRCRTAIIIRPAYTAAAGNDVVLLTAFHSSGTGVIGVSYTDGITLWELRQYILSVYNDNEEYPIVGISIDGGGSTQIAYKESGNRVCVQAEARAVRTMIQTPM